MVLDLGNSKIRRLLVEIHVGTLTVAVSTANHDIRDVVGDNHASSNI